MTCRRCGGDAYGMGICLMCEQIEKLKERDAEIARLRAALAAGPAALRKRIKAAEAQRQSTLGHLSSSWSAVVHELCEALDDVEAAQEAVMKEGKL